MKLSIDPKLLADLIGWAARALPARPTVPILAGLLLEADNDTLTVSAFDYDLAVRGHAAADIAEPGRIILPGRILAEVAKALPDRTLVDLTAGDRDATITCGRSEFTLPTLPVDDFPTLPEPPNPVGTVDGPTLAAAVTQVAPACTHDDKLPMLSGIRIDADGDRLTLAATDRYRIAVRDLDWQPAADNPLGRLIPGHTLHDIARGLHGDVTIGLDDRLASISTPDRVMTIRLIDEQFIDYRSRVNLDSTTTATVDAATLTEAVKRVALVADRKSGTSIRLNFTTGEVLVQAGGLDIGRGHEAIEAELDGDPIEIAFQAQFLLDALAGIDGPAQIGMQAPDRPAIFRATDGSYQCLAMSLRQA